MNNNISRGLTDTEREQAYLSSPYHLSEYEGGYLCGKVGVRLSDISEVVERLKQGVHINMNNIGEYEEESEEKAITSLNELNKRLDDLIKSGKINKRTANMLLEDIFQGFRGVIRIDTTHYIDHLTATLNNLCTHFPDEVDEISICTALLHDTLEDTNQSFAYLKKRYGNEIALGVLALTKPALWDASEDLKPERSNDIRQMLIKIVGEDIQHDQQIDEDKIDENKKLEFYRIQQVLKRVRNKKYDERFAAAGNLQRFIIYTAEKEKIPLNDEVLERITKRVARVKLCDRKHNLDTIPDTQISKKIRETENMRHLHEIYGGKLWGIVLKQINTLKVQQEKKQEKESVTG